MAHLLCAGANVGLLGATPRNLVVFRSRSRHTYDFASESDAFDLPLLELASLLSPCLELTASAPSDDAGVYWADGVSPQDLKTASERAILLHGAFSVAASAPSVALLCEQARQQSLVLPNPDTELEVIDLNQPNLQRDARDELKRLVRLHSAAHATTSPDTAEPCRVLLRERHGEVHLGWRIASGPAAGGGAPGLATGRRCYSGWLGRYALKNRQHAAPTAMEPEIAFLMANLARVGTASHVLDPTCGSGGLLLAATVLGARHVVGVDRNASAFAGCASEFERFGLARPNLAGGDVLAPDDSPQLHGSEYDAIICDPPYGLRAPIFVGGSPSTAHEQGQPPDLTAAVLDVAARTLRPGGRAVLFVPVRGQEIELPLEELLWERRLAGRRKPPLRVVFGRMQRFSTRRSRRAGSSASRTRSRGGGAFARWLVCLERVSVADAAPGQAASKSLVEQIKSVGSDWKQALQLTDAVEELDAYAACAAISACAKAGEWRPALRLLRCLHLPDRACFHAVLAACERADTHQADGDDARAAAEAAQKLLADMHARGMEPSSSCFTSAGRAAMRCGDWRSALSAFDAIIANGLEPLYSDVKAAIIAAERGRAWDRVVQLVRSASRIPARSSQRTWLWRAWCSSQLRLMHSALMAAHGDAVDPVATRALQRALTLAASDGWMPSFAEAGARAGYALAHLSTRTIKVADTLRVSEPTWFAKAVEHALQQEVVISIGGGPGFDFAAITLLQAFASTIEHGLHRSGSHSDGTTPVTLVLDFESGWAIECEAISDAVQEVLGDRPRFKFEHMDVTVPVDHEANAALLSALPSSKLAIVSYVVAENARALEDSDFAFFESFYARAPLGATMLILETTHRSFPDIVRAARRGVKRAGSTFGLHVHCPWVQSNGGHSLVLQKHDGCKADHGKQEQEAGCSVESLLSSFECDAKMHAMRSDSTSTRKYMKPRESSIKVNLE